MDKGSTAAEAPGALSGSSSPCLVGFPDPLKKSVGEPGYPCPDPNAVCRFAHFMAPWQVAGWGWN